MNEYLEFLNSKNLTTEACGKAAGDIHPVLFDFQAAIVRWAWARANEDERHLCPLQLDLIERCIKMWSNPGELVFSPFGGIGSEIYEAIKWRRRGLAIELKPEYFKVACQNLREAEMKFGRTLFDLIAENSSEVAS